MAVGTGIVASPVTGISQPVAAFSATYAASDKQSRDRIDAVLDAVNVAANGGFASLSVQDRQHTLRQLATFRNASEPFSTATAPSEVTAAANAAGRWLRSGRHRGDSRAPLYATPSDRELQKVPEVDEQQHIQTAADAASLLSRVFAPGSEFGTLPISF
jgi:hypothetical protein